MERIYKLILKGIEKWKSNKVRKRASSVLAFIIVFVTVYSLIIPAITLEQSVAEKMPGTDAGKTFVYDCGEQVHNHTRVCDETRPVYDADGKKTGTEKVLICGKADWAVHVHDDSCYQAVAKTIVEDGVEKTVTENVLVCTLPEIEEHRHTSDCYAENGDLICGQPELHSHTIDCYERGPEDQSPEEMGWIHYETDADGNRVLVGDPKHLICGKPELLAHQHDAHCFRVEEVPVSDAENEAEVNAAEGESGLDEGGLTGEEGVLSADGLFDIDDVAVPEGLLGDERTSEIGSVEDDSSNTNPAAVAEEAHPENDGNDGTEQVYFFDENGEGALQETESTDAGSTLETAQKQNKILTSDGNGYKILVTCGVDAGVPENAKLEVREIEPKEEVGHRITEYERYENKTAKVLGRDAGSLNYARFFDIKIVDENGNEIQPADGTTVSVRIELADTDSERLSVVHFGEERAEVVNAQTEDAAVSFEAAGFSVYAVVDEGTADVSEARMTLKFFDENGNIITTVYVKNDDDSDDELEQIIYDPGIGILKSGELFKGWIIDKQDYTVEDAENKMDIIDIRAWAKEKANANSIVEGEVHNIYPMIYKTYSVTFKDEDGITIHSEALITRAIDESIDYTINVSYAPKEQDEVFQGWHWTCSSGGEVVAKDGSSAPFPNGTEVEINDHTTFTVNVPKGYWLSFVENGNGASYTPPQFIPAEGGTVSVMPSNPTRQGYTFAGWNTKADGSGDIWTSSDFGKKLTGKTTLYAQWTPIQTAPYTVIIWKQNLDGDGYDFEESFRLNGTVGQNVSSVSQRNTGNNAYARIEGRPNGRDVQYTGFHLKEFDQNVEIKPEGNTVVNVYYDRTEYTFTFRDEGVTYTQNNNGNYGLVDNVYVRLSQGNQKYYLAYNDGTPVPVGTTVYSSNGWNWEDTIDPTDTRITYYASGNYNTALRWVRYSGTRYNRSSSVQTIHTVTAKYGADISGIWNFTGTNGKTYPQTSPVTSWQPSGSSTYTARITRMEIMPAENITFTHTTTNNTIRYFHYYVETVDGEAGDLEFGGRQYNLYVDLPNDFNIVYYNDDFWQLSGFTRQAIRKANNNHTNYYAVNLSEGENISWNNLNNWYYGQDNHLYFFYTRNKFAINYMDGQYVDGNGAPLDEINQGQLKVVNDIYYQADISSYNKGGENYYEPVKAGYVFEGWYLDDACTHPVTFNKMPEGGITVYAKWRQKQYRVFLHPNVPTSDRSFDMGGQGTSFRVDYGDKIAGGNEIHAIRDDYELIGWYTDEACTQPFNFDAYVLNDTTVTTAYSKTENTELDKYGNPTEIGNKDAAGNRFWIDRKIDLYAKWRSKIVGAPGINVQYDAVEGQGEFPDGNTIHTDPLTYYLDRAESTAQQASVPTNEDKQFMYWVVQRWDDSQQKYIDTNEHVYPGDTFEVKLANAREENIIPDPSTPDITKKYTVQLRAEYSEKDAPTPTHIWWFPNDKELNAMHDAMEHDDSLQINQAVDIPTPESREGYRFLGWARIDHIRSESVREEGTANPKGKVLELGKEDLFLTYHEASGDYTATINGEVKKVTKVAADEQDPYHDMYAVWEKAYTVTVRKVVVGTAEDKEISFQFNETQNIDGVVGTDTFPLTHNNVKEYKNLFPKESQFSITEIAGEGYNLEDYNITVAGVYTDDSGEEHEISGLSNGSNITIQGDTEITVTNTRKAKLVRIYKIDDSDPAVPLANIEFTLNNKPLTTGANGYTDTITLNTSETPYSLAETSPNEKYAGLPAEVPVTVSSSGVTVPEETENVSVFGPDQDGVYTITVVNPLIKTSLTIIKRDQFGKALEGAKFDLVGEGITDQKDKISAKKDETGDAIVIEDLEVPLGTYTLKETGTPDGYNALEGPIEIKVTKNESGDVVVEATINGKVDEAHAKLERDTSQTDKPWKLIVTNDAGVELPHTGGSGTRLIYLIGSMLMAFALAGLLLTRRRNAKM